jgi:hypothetical protein
MTLPPAGGLDQALSEGGIRKIVEERIGLITAGVAPDSEPQEYRPAP